MQFYLVDAFSSKPFSGNPAAVVFTPNRLNESDYLKYSSEFNLSETAFLYPIDSSDFITASKFQVKTIMMKYRYD